MLPRQAVVCVRIRSKLFSGRDDGPVGDNPGLPVSVTGDPSLSHARIQMSAGLRTVAWSVSLAHCTEPPAPHTFVEHTISVSIAMTRSNVASANAASNVEKRVVRSNRQLLEPQSANLEWRRFIDQRTNMPPKPAGR